MNALAIEAIDFDTLDYAAVFDRRVAALARMRTNPATVPALRDYYRDHLADFICDWGMTYDPRNVGVGKPPDLPFLLFPRQREWIDWTYQNWRDGSYGGTEKSRDVGLSWLFIAFSVSLCVLYEGVAVGWGSYKEEKVDKRGDIGSLFEKGRYYLENLPAEFSAGFERRTCSTERSLIFPATRSSVIGEIGDHIGRGGRTSIYFVDEAAYLEHDQIVDAALSKNSRCRQDVSSVRGMTNTFAQRMHDGYSRRFTFHWRENPLFSEKMYEAFKQQWGSVITAQELDIDYQASVEGVIIAQEWVQAAIGAHEKLGLTISGDRMGALDVADQGRDVNAFAVRHGVLLTHVEGWRGVGSDLFETTERAFIICDQRRLDSFCYDADGLGAGVRGDATRINARRQKSQDRHIHVSEFRGSAAVHHPDRTVGGTDRKALDMFQNLKAQSWWELRDRFQNTFRAVNGLPYDADEIICIDKSIACLAQLSIELSQPQWKISGSGKLMVDKVPDGAMSPNLADAVMMLFAQPRGGLNINPAILEM